MPVVESVHPTLAWSHAGQPRHALWLGEVSVPKRVQMADDTLTADAAHRLLCAGTALCWQGDFQNARQLLQAVARRADKRAAKETFGGTAPPAATAVRDAAPTPALGADSFHRYRMGQAQRARILGGLLVPLAGDFSIPLRRAPEVRTACREAFGCETLAGDAVLPLRQLLGIIGAHEWRHTGLALTMLDAPGRGPAVLRPHYGVFAPVRGEYLMLMQQRALPDPCHLAMDIGTGSGVLAALLAGRGVAQVLASDHSPRALACARENIAALGFAQQVRVVDGGLFPESAQCAELIVCNPPWLPGKAGSLLEQAIFDPDSRMLRGFLAGLRAHLCAHGEGWLILSDIAELLGLRQREELLAWIAAAGLVVKARLYIRPSHPRSRDATDPLHAARSRETTSLWVLAHAAPVPAVSSAPPAP